MNKSTILMVIALGFGAAAEAQTQYPYSEVPDLSSLTGSNPVSYTDSNGITSTWTVGTITDPESLGVDVVGVGSGEIYWLHPRVDDGVGFAPGSQVLNISFSSAVNLATTMRGVGNTPVIGYAVERLTFGTAWDAINIYDPALIASGGTSLSDPNNGILGSLQAEVFHNGVTSLSILHEGFNEGVNGEATNNGGATNSITSFSYEVVPEPSSMILSVIAAIALASRRRR